MHIAEIAPLAESVPPSLYGGTERVVSWLTEELIDLGETVTLFASGGSKTRGTGRCLSEAFAVEPARHRSDGGARDALRMRGRAGARV